MSEFARLLRYAIPGGVFELAVATWVFVGIEAGAYNTTAIQVTEPALIALLIAATFPLGFLISVVANEIAWLLYPLYPRCPRGRLWGRIGTTRIMCIARRSHHWMSDVVAEMQPSTCYDEQAYVEVVLLSAHSGSMYAPVNARLRSLADLMNGLVNVAVAVLIALVVGVLAVVFRLASELSVGALNFDVLLGILVLAWWSLVFILLCCAEGRVARIAEAFAVAMIGAGWRDD